MRSPGADGVQSAISNHPISIINASSITCTPFYGKERGVQGLLRRFQVCVFPPPTVVKKGLPAISPKWVLVAPPPGSSLPGSHKPLLAPPPWVHRRRPACRPPRPPPLQRRGSWRRSTCTPPPWATTRGRPWPRATALWKRVRRAPAAVPFGPPTSRGARERFGFLNKTVDWSNDGVHHYGAPLNAGWSCAELGGCPPPPGS